MSYQVEALRSEMSLRSTSPLKRKLNAIQHVRLASKYAASAKPCIHASVFSVCPMFKVRVHTLRTKENKSECIACKAH